MELGTSVVVVNWAKLPGLGGEDDAAAEVVLDD